MQLLPYGNDKPCCLATTLDSALTIGVTTCPCRLQLYPFEHVPARYIGVIAAGDAKLEVAEAGKAALRPPKPSAAGACSAGTLKRT